MFAIEVNNLSKTFRIKQKDKGIKGSIKSIFKPKYNEKKAVNNVSYIYDIYSYTCIYSI